MIQRIQSVFLLLVSGAAFSLFGLPFANSTQVIANSALFSDQSFNIMDDQVMLGLFCAAGAFAFIAIFLFKNRILQSRLVQVAILVLLGGIGWGIYKFTQDTAVQAGDTIQYSFGLASPVLAIVFAILALRFISKDEKLVKSMDRLR